MKNSVDSKQAAALLASHFYRFKTENFSFRYCAAPSAAFGFSVGRALGSSVLRNRLKRRMRHVLSGPSFRALSLCCIIRPFVLVKSYSDICFDFNAFQKSVIKKLNS